MSAHWLQIHPRLFSPLEIQLTTFSSCPGLMDISPSSEKRCSYTGEPCKCRMGRGPLYGPSLGMLLAQYHLLSAKQSTGRCLRGTMAINSKVYLRPAAIWWSCCCLTSVLKGKKSVEMLVCFALSFPSPWISDLGGIKTKSGARKALSVPVA